MDNKILALHIAALPIGYSEVLWKARKYGVTRRDFSHGKSTKVLARELGGNDLVSFNFYFFLARDNLKPCEMPGKKVMD